MESSNESKTRIKKNKGKFAVLVLYIFIVFLSPLYLFTPLAHNQLQGIISSLVSNDADQFFRQYISALQENNIDQAYSMLSPEAQEVTATTSLQTLATYFASTTDSMEVVGGTFNSTTNQSGTVTKYAVYYQIHNDDPVDKYIIAFIQAEDAGDGLTINTVQANTSTESTQEQGKFSLTEQWIPLVLSLLIPLFIVYTAYRYITKAFNPKWVLFLIILLLSLTVTITGEKVAANFGLQGFIAQGGSWGSWLFNLPVPLGAIYYYFVFRKKEMIPVSPETVEPSEN